MVQTLPAVRHLEVIVSRVGRLDDLPKNVRLIDAVPLVDRIAVAERRAELMQTLAAVPRLNEVIPLVNRRDDPPLHVRLVDAVPLIDG